MHAQLCNVVLAVCLGLGSTLVTDTTQVRSEEIEFVLSDGFITSGDDLFVADLTPDESRKKCLSLDGCTGFTFHGDSKADHSKMGKIKTYFKSKTEVLGKGNGWSSYVRSDALDNAVGEVQSGPMEASQNECADQNHQCAYWSVIGECKKNPTYMHVVCRPSCRMCGGEQSDLGNLYVALQEKYLGKTHIDAVPHPPRPRMTEASFDPRVYVIDNFLSHEECDFLMKHAQPHLQVARTINATTGLTQPDKVRTNQQMYIADEDCRHHTQIKSIIDRMHKLVRIPYGHAEALQVGRYQAGEFYEPHFDSEPGANVIRSATVIVYLEAPEGGGGSTVFPKTAQCNGRFNECCDNIQGMIHDGGGLAVTPDKGKAVMFFTHDLDGRLNPLALHGSCPVHTGFKWIAQQWFRSKPFPASPHFQSSKHATKEDIYE